MSQPQNSRGVPIENSPANPSVRRTKIVCTLGPASDGSDVIERLIDAGMNVARINMSHGTHEKHADTIRRVREVGKKLDVRVPILMDLTGPKMRIGTFADGSIDLAAGDSFTLTAREVPGDETVVSINYPPLVADVGPGDRILMGDGEIELSAKSKTETDILCEVVVGGELRSNKGINAPGVKLGEEVPTNKDIDDVRFGIEQDVDWLALSFVRYAHEVERLREFLIDHDADIPVVVKVEKNEALDNLDEILKVTNAVMIARGDLGLELPIAEVPLVQKDIIVKAIEAGRPVITATQMLESMIENPRPTRAEAADVANAVFDGTDAVMLSGETAMGRYPVEAVRTMARVAAASETRIDYRSRFSSAELHRHGPIADAIAHAACHTAIEMDARAIVCCTRSGQSARLVSRYRPPMPIVAVSPHPKTQQRVGLYWNTVAVDAPLQDDVDQMISAAKAAVLRAGIAAEGDRVVVVAGVPVDEPGTTNVIKGDIL